MRGIRSNQGNEDRMIAKKGRRGRSALNEDGTPRAVDVHVGSRIRMRRLYLGQSQSELARAVGLTFQQIQKYERGLNRVSASRLYDLARVLDVPVSFFFDDMPEGIDLSGPGGAGAQGRNTAEASDLTNPLAQRETAELVRSYYNIADPNVRKRVYEMVKALAAEVDAAEAEAEASVGLVIPAPGVDENDGPENGTDMSH